MTSNHANLIWRPSLAFCRLWNGKGDKNPIRFQMEGIAMLKRFRVPGRLALKLKEHGVSVATVLRRAGLPSDLFEQTRVLVSTEELFALWQAIEVVSSDPLIGVKLGVETKTERFHPMAIAALST
jgi:hypothetical protein